LFFVFFRFSSVLRRRCRRCPSPFLGGWGVAVCVVGFAYSSSLFCGHCLFSSVGLCPRSFGSSISAHNWAYRISWAVRFRVSWRCGASGSYSHLLSVQVIFFHAPCIGILARCRLSKDNMPFGGIPFAKGGTAPKGLCPRQPYRVGFFMPLQRHPIRESIGKSQWSTPFQWGLGRMFWFLS